jgi:hypothetical protein
LSREFTNAVVSDGKMSTRRRSGDTRARRVQGRHPLETSDAVGAAAAQVGPRALSTAAVLHKQHGLPLGKAAGLYQHISA